MWGRSRTGKCSENMDCSAEESFFGVVCDDTLFFKITEAGRRVCPGLPEEPPYEGARNYLLVEEVDDRELLTQLAAATCEELPEPKEKRKRSRKQRGKEDGI